RGRSAASRTSDGCRMPDGRHLPAESLRGSLLVLSAPPLPGGLGRPTPLCTGPVAPLAGRGDDAPLQPELLAHLRLDRRGHVGRLGQEAARVPPALADAVAAEGVPGAGLLEDAVLRGEVDQLALLRDAGAVEDVELGLAERRRDLVLHHLHLGAAAD